MKKPPGTGTLGVLRKSTVPQLITAAMSAGVKADVLPHLTALCKLVGFDGIGHAGSQTPMSAADVRLERADVAPAVRTLEQILLRLRSVTDLGSLEGGADVLLAVEELDRATGYPIPDRATGHPIEVADSDPAGVEQCANPAPLVLRLLEAAYRIYHQHRQQHRSHLTNEDRATVKASIAADDGYDVGRMPEEIEALVLAIDDHHPEVVLSMARGYADAPPSPAVAPQLMDDQKVPGFWVSVGVPGSFIATTYGPGGAPYGGPGRTLKEAEAAALEAVWNDDLAVGVVVDHEPEVRSLIEVLEEALELASAAGARGS